MGSEAEVQSEPAPEAPKSGSGGKGILIAVVAIAIVAVVVIAFMFMGSGAVEGKWTFDDVEVHDEDGTLNQTASDAFEADQNDAWIQFNSDGTVEMGDANGTSDMENQTYETDGDTLTLTYTYEMPSPEYNSTTGNITWNNQTITDTTEYTYSVSGNTMTLEFDMEGKTVKITASRG